LRALTLRGKPVLTSFVLWFLASTFLYFIQPLQPFQSIAHRGASFYAPENTIASFQKALELGFDFIELDVRLSKDEQLVVIHDKDVNRTTNSEGDVDHFTAAQLKMLDAGSWFSPDYKDEKIPLLEEVLTAFGGKIGLLIEVKSPESQPGIIDRLSQMLNEHVAGGLNADKIKVQSFNIKEMKNFHKQTPEIAAGILLNKPLDTLELASYRPFASFLSIHHQLISKSFIKHAQLLGFDVFSWTIKKQYQFQMMQRLGVHGIISNEEYREPSSNLTVLITPFL